MGVPQLLFCPGRRRIGRPVMLGTVCPRGGARSRPVHGRSRRSAPVRRYRSATRSTPTSAMSCRLTDSTWRGCTAPTPPAVRSSFSAVRSRIPRLRQNRTSDREASKSSGSHSWWTGRSNRVQSQLLEDRIGVSCRIRSLAGAHVAVLGLAQRPPGAVHRPILVPLIQRRRMTWAPLRRNRRRVFLSGAGMGSDVRRSAVRRRCRWSGYHYPTSRPMTLKDWGPRGRTMDKDDCNAALGRRGNNSIPSGIRFSITSRQPSSARTEGRGGRPDLADRSVELPAGASRHEYVPHHVGHCRKRHLQARKGSACGCARKANSRGRSMSHPDPRRIFLAAARVEDSAGARRSTPLQDVAVPGHQDIRVAGGGGSGSTVPIIGVADFQWGRRGGLGHTSSPARPSSARMSLTVGAGSLMRSRTTVSSSSRITSPVISSCWARTARTRSAQSPRVADAATRTLVSRNTLT